jgi:hypothetical protein
LGLSKAIPLFSGYLKFIINFLDKNIKKQQEEFHKILENIDLTFLVK